MKALSPVERKALRARAHSLHPVVMIGNAGLTPAVLNEIDLALKSHELIKMRMLGDDRAARKIAIERVCDALDASPIQLIGKILVIFRARPQPAEAPAAPPARSKAKRRPKRAAAGPRGKSNAEGRPRRAVATRSTVQDGSSFQPKRKPGNLRQDGSSFRRKDKPRRPASRTSRSPRYRE